MLKSRRVLKLQYQLIDRGLIIEGRYDPVKGRPQRCAIRAAQASRQSQRAKAAPGQQQGWRHVVKTAGAWRSAP